MRVLLKQLDNRRHAQNEDAKATRLFANFTFAQVLLLTSRVEHETSSADAATRMWQALDMMFSTSAQAVPQASLHCMHASLKA